MSGAARQCANCGHALSAGANYCAHCGQDTANHPPTLFEFVHEFISHYIAAEGKLWKSLWALMARPGFLTLEYLAGRKQRYVLPLRLILTLGLVFFLALKLSPGAQSNFVTGGQPPPAAAASAPGQDAPFVLDGDDSTRLPPSLRERIERANAKWRANPEASAKALGHTMLSLAPYAVLGSLPFFAGLLKLLYWRQPYGAHFVFALHLHAAWYGMLLLLFIPGRWLGIGLWAWANIYPLLALKRVHLASWPSTLLRGLALALAHLMLLGLGFVTVVLAGALAI